jgi:hypothetical protein
LADEAGNTFIADLNVDNNWPHIKQDALCEIRAEDDKGWNCAWLSDKNLKGVSL